MDFGIYINADDIAQELKKGKLNFKNYHINITSEEFIRIADSSGLINSNFKKPTFLKSFEIVKNQIRLKDLGYLDRIAQIIAEFLRQKLLEENKKFSFETVFSHKSKVDFIRKARDKGYKVYLYYVSTKDPEINKYRVKVRVKKGGHDVPENKIEERYYKSLDIMYDAAQLSYQTFFFDNSDDDEK